MTKLVNEEVCSEKRNCRICRICKICRNERREESRSNQSNGKSFTEEAYRLEIRRTYKISGDKEKENKMSPGEEQGETKLKGNETWKNQEAVSMRV